MERNTKVFYKNHIHQRSTYTKTNRYPVLFQICSYYFKNNPEPKLLSFGCSTGEETNSLRDYLPFAQIYGIDINKYCLKQCKKKFAHHKTRFYHSLSKEFNDLKEMDAIFCLAVFQHPENRNNFHNNTSHYEFSKFENQITELDAKLKTRGLLFIDQCDFNFLDTIVSKRYSVLNVTNNQVKRLRPIFNHKNEKLADESNNYRVFQKLQ